MRQPPPVEVIVCEDGRPGQRARFTAENASLFDPLGSPEGGSKTGLLSSATGYVASCVTSRQRHGARTRILRRRRPPARQPAGWGDLDHGVPRPQIASPSVLPAGGATGPAEGGW